VELKNPLVVEGVEVFFGHRVALRSYVFFFLTLLFVLLASWPAQPLTAYMEDGARPMTFGFVAVTLYLWMTYMAARFATTRFAGERFHPTTDWLEHAPVGRTRIITGRIGFAVFHLLFLGLTALPFVIVAGAATGIRGGHELACAAVILAASLAYRMIGVFFSLFLDERPFYHAVLTWFCVFFLAFLTLFLRAEMNPLNTLFAVMGQNLLAAAGMPAAALQPEELLRVTVRIHLIIAAAFGAASVTLIHLLPGGNGLRLPRGRRRPLAKRPVSRSNGKGRP